VDLSVAREPWPAPDDDQARVIAHRGGALVVLGAPGTGKTGTALRVVADRVSGDELTADDVLFLTPTRRSAARLRDELAANLGRTTGQPAVRTASSAAFAILRARAVLLGEPPPTLISGPEQDLVLAELLAGHAAGEGAGVQWPASVPAGAAGLRAFRDELRDLLMRAAERGLGPDGLARLGRAHDRPEWVTAAAVYAEYLDVTRLRTGTPDAGARYDPAVIVDEAAEALAAWAEEVSAPRPRWRLVVVDDHQESTAATARLLHALADDGAELVLMADPDAAVQAFRGASPALVDRATLPSGSELGAFGADQLVLGRVWRHGAPQRAVVRAVTDQIRGTGRAQRRAVAAAGEGTAGAAQVALLRSPAQETAHIAYLLRDAHLHDGVPWHRMAVVVRSGAQVATLRRALVDAQVPVAVTGSDLPLRAEPAVRPLLAALDCVVRPDQVTPEVVADLLGSPIGGLDAVALRRLRRALRLEELAGGGARSSDELLVEAVADPRHGATLPPGVRRGVRRLAGALAAGRDAGAAPGATALDVLWAIWAATDLATVWRQSALAGGPGGARADRDLDAVLALFAAAEQFVDRLPRAPVAAFVEYLRAQDLPADSLAARGDPGGAVDLVTAAGAAGGEWDVVVVAGVQEGVWPDLRLRDHLLGAQHLVEVLAGRAVPGDRFAEARAAVLDDELRAFAVAVSRATRRLVVTAVRDTDNQPSPLVDLVDPPDDRSADRRLVTVPAALDLRAVVGQCRAWLEADCASGGAAAAHPAARLLARLAAQDVPGAHPDQWYGVAAASTSDPLWPADAQVPLSPSRLEAAWTCALRWALEAAGGTAADSTEQSLGTLVHEVAAALPHGTEPELAAAVAERWDSLGLPEGWVGAVHRRRAAAMVHHLAEYLRAHPDVAGVERPFAVAVGRVVLRGVVDRLEIVDGAVRVVDLKTGRNALRLDEAARHAQLGAYQLAVEAGAFDDVAEGGRSGGAALVYVGAAKSSYTQREQPALRDDPDPRWAEALLEDVADVVSRSAVAATGNDLCQVCPVRRSCPLQAEGRVVGS
jgi:superfamily I DNA/RNA helicase/RecB family exonuclease